MSAAISLSRCGRNSSSRRKLAERPFTWPRGLRTSLPELSFESKVAIRTDNSPGVKLDWHPGWKADFRKRRRKQSSPSVEFRADDGGPASDPWVAPEERRSRQLEIVAKCRKPTTIANERDGAIHFNHGEPAAGG